jgi:DNA-binding transcriptional MerR regulator
MIRKRSWRTRARDRRRRRPKHPAPQDGFLLHQVAHLTGVPVRTLRDYVRRGLLHYSERRGTITRYPRSEVIRLLGALRLKAQTKATWSEIKRQLDTFSAADFERWLAEPGLAPAVAVELGVAPLTSALTPNPDAPNGSAAEGAAGSWQRTELLPGLELFLSPSASTAVKHAAQRIIEEHKTRV